MGLSTDPDIRPPSEASDIRNLLAAAVAPDYRVGELIGRGGMAYVFLAEDVALERKVAIKVLPPDLTFGAGSERFVREARVSAALSHPHIVSVYRVSAQGSLVWYAMQYLDGDSLDKLIASRGQMDLRETIDILRQLANALDYLHGKGVVHRDLKPSNVVIDSTGNATLMDFGIAKAMSGGSLTASGMVVGTPDYMAPEQLNGGALTGAADQYSVGVLAYQMLTGERAFGGDTVMAIMKAHLFDGPPSLDVARPDLAGAPTEAIRRALAKDPNDRFPTVTAFVEGLSSTGASANAAVAARAPSSAAPRVSGEAEPVSVWRQILSLVGWPEPSDAVRRDASRRMSARVQSAPPPRRPSVAGRPSAPRKSVERLFNMETGMFYDARTLMAAPPRSVTQDLVFLSYKRGTDETFALTLARSLKELGIPVWVDQWDIQAGRRWDEAIEEALNTCTHLLLIVSPDALESDEVRDEFLMALDERKTVVPVIHRAPERLHRRLRTIQNIDFTERVASDRNGLIKIVRALGLAELVDLEPADVLEAPAGRRSPTTGQRPAPGSQQPEASSP